MGKGFQLFFFLMLSCVMMHLCSADIFIVDAGPAPDMDAEINQGGDITSMLDASPLGKNLNEIVDLIIHFAQETLKKTGRATIKVPDIEEEFSKRIHFIKIKGKFKAENGWFKDLSSIHRTADATLSHSGGNITATISLGLGTMQLGFDHYRVKVEHLVSVSGKIRAEAGSNSVLVRVNVMMLKTGKCNLTLQDLRITKLDGLKVHVEGKAKPVNWVMSKIATSVVRHMKKKIVHDIENHLTDAAQKALDKYHC